MSAAPPTPINQDNDEKISTALQSLVDYSRSLLDQFESTTDQSKRAKFHDQIDQASKLSNQLLQMQLSGDDSKLQAQAATLKTESTNLKNTTSTLKTIITDGAAFLTILSYAIQIATVVATL